MAIASSDREDRGGGVLKSWLDKKASISTAGLYALAIVLVALVGALDGLTGTEVSFSLFYLAPVAFAGGLVSRRAGRFVAVLSAVVWGYLEIKNGRPYTASWIPLWNALVRLGFFLIVNELIEALRRAHRHERALSRTDSLTGIANGRVFDEQTERTIAESRRNRRPFTIAYIDLDRFKQINDGYGHSEGDRLLREVAAVIQAHLRSTDLAARLGGDEFGVLMPDTGKEQARVSLERVATEFARRLGNRWPVGATLGAVTFTEPPRDADSAVREADALMYKGKAAGGGRILQTEWSDSGKKAAEPGG
jgi:diguanylate cyclase (GGDEF)-like protein